MNEKEAKEKWCPFVRFVVGTSAPFNRAMPGDGQFYENPDEARCIASQCACWRWTDDMVFKGEEPQGYCGLAPGRREPKNSGFTRKEFDSL